MGRKFKSRTIKGKYLHTCKKCKRFFKTTALFGKVRPDCKRGNT